MLFGNGKGSCLRHSFRDLNDSDDYSILRREYRLAMKRGKSRPDDLDYSGR